MLIDLEGRVNNYDLAFSKAAFPIFEAVINSIHSIQEARESGLLPTRGGRISIELERQPALRNDDGDSVVGGVIEHVAVEDDGVGFNDVHFKSFNTSDTTQKRSLGGRGIGRFTWLKAFERTEIRSVYPNPDGSHFVRTFSFTLPNGVSADVVEPAAEGAERRTRVRLVGARARYSTEIPRRTEVLARRIIEHCLDFFVVSEAPTIVLLDPGHDPVSLNDLYANEVGGKAQTETIHVGGRQFSARHLLVSTRAGTQHRLHFCANRRVVRTEPLGHHLVDLEEQIDQEGGKPCVYAGYVSGEYLDQTVTPERTDFRIARAPDLLSADDLRWPDLVDACIRQVQGYLKPFTEPIRDAKREHIERYVQHEAPRFRPLLKHRPNVIDAIPHNLSNDRLDLELYKHQRHYEDELRAEGAKVLTAAEGLDQASLEEYERILAKFLEQWNEVGVSRLAEYVVHRRATLNLLEKTLQASADGRYALEAAVHQVIFPLRTTSDDVPADQMNLWIIDEKLAYHHYLASDKPFSSMDVVRVDGQQRPDILVFDRPVAFVDRPSGHDAVTIIEFKRPRRDDYDDDHNPILQVYDYVDRIKQGTVVDRVGRPLTVAKSTRFYAYIICDLTPSLMKQAKGASLTLMPDGQGFFGYNPEYSTLVEVISFQKLVEDAKARNRILFDKLENRG